MRGYLTRGRVSSFRTIVASGCFVYTRNEFLIQIDVLRRREATFRGNWAAPVVDLVVGPVEDDLLEASARTDHLRHVVVIVVGGYRDGDILAIGGLHDLVDLP